MNLSPNMLAALRFFAGNVSEQTQTADKFLNTTVAALWRRELLAVNTDGIIIPNEAGFVALAEPDTAEEDRHSSMDAGIQLQGCEGDENEPAEIKPVLGSGLRHPCRNDEVNELVASMTKECTRKNSRKITSSESILSTAQAIVAEREHLAQEHPVTAQAEAQIAQNANSQPLPPRVQVETYSSTPTPTHSNSKCNPLLFPHPLLAWRFFPAMVAGLAGFRAVWRQ